MGVSKRRKSETYLLSFSCFVGSDELITPFSARFSTVLMSTLGAGVGVGIGVGGGAVVSLSDSPKLRDLDDEVEEE